jgi:hypothetical protein
LSNTSTPSSCYNTQKRRPACATHQSLPSDWSILNSIDAGKLRRCLLETDGFTGQKIEQTCRLIESYHAVYRRDLLQLRRQGYLGKCPSPALNQLQQIAQKLGEQESQIYSTEHVLLELKTLATYLRQQIASAN